MSQRLKAIAPSGGPIHRMQPSSGAIPPIEFHLLDDGQAELCMFCRSGPSRGKWWSRTGPAAELLGFFGHLHSCRSDPEQILREMEQFFSWEWDLYGSTGLAGAGPDSGGPTSGLTLEDLGL